MKQQVVEGRPLQAQTGQFPVQLQGRGPWGRQELVHVEAVALLAGDAAGGGVGLGQQALLLQGSHGGPHRGGAGG